MFPSHSPMVGKSFVGSPVAGQALPTNSSPSSAASPTDSTIDVLGMPRCAAVATSGVFWGEASLN